MKNQVKLTNRIPFCKFEAPYQEILDPALPFVLSPKKGFIMMQLVFYIT